MLGSHDVISTDALGGLLHASFQFAESPADADTIMRLRIFALALRTEGRCQRFAFRCTPFVEAVVRIEGYGQSLVLQERAVQPETIGNRVTDYDDDDGDDIEEM